MKGLLNLAVGVGEASMLEQVQEELDLMKESFEVILDENSNLHNLKIQTDSKNESLVKNTQFLEEKLASTLTQKEEIVIRLKSEIVIYKNKIKQYKLKINDSVKGIETKKMEDMQIQLAKDLAIKDKITQNLEIENLTTQLNDQIAKNEFLQAQNNNLAESLSSQQEEFNSLLGEKNQAIQELASQISGIDQEYLKKITDINFQRESTQKKLNIEEQERSMNSIKLEYLLGNIKKLQLQKKFLQKAIENDLKKLDLELKKNQMDLQREQFVSSQVSFIKIQNMYQTMKTTLKYVNDVVGFMNFDTEEQSFRRRDQSRLKRVEENEEREGEDGSDHMQEGERTDFRGNQMQGGNVDSIENYFYKNIYELAEVMLSIMSQLYKESRTQTSTDLIQLFDLLQAKTEKRKVQEIYNKYFASSRIHFTQFINKLNEKGLDLETERNDLRLQLNKTKRELAEFMQDASGQDEQESLRRQSQIEQEEEGKTHKNPKSEFQRVPTISNNQNRDDLNMIETDNTPSKNLNTSIEFKNAALKDIYSGNQSIQRQSPAAVKEALIRGLDKKVGDLFMIENQALKERVKEVRLNFQRQLNEQNEYVKQLKDQHQTELNKLKLEYGVDLKSLNRMSRNKEEQLKNELIQQNELALQELKLTNDSNMKNTVAEYEQKLEELQTLLEKSEILRLEFERDLRKLKKQSTLVHQGGWGTFSIAFEEYTSRHKHLNQSKDSLFPRKTSIGDAMEYRDDDDEENKPVDSQITRISHFIEVGFLMDEKNFKHVDIYRERTFDSSLVKHLYEFQDPIDNQKMILLQNKIRSQLHENYALFNEINPVYVSLNMGKPILSSGEHSISQESFKLIKREGNYIGEKEMMVSFLRCEQESSSNPLTIRIIAFDSESYSQYSLDLLYDDLMILMDRNQKLLEEEQGNDLCQMLTNNLTLISKKGTTKLGKEKIEKILAVEHKIFFNEQYRQEFDQRNKLILTKHDKRKKGLLQEKTLQTDFERSLLYEAYDSVYCEELKLNEEHQLISLSLEKGRMSENLVLKINIGNLTFLELILYSSREAKCNLSHQISSEIVSMQQSNDDKDSVLAYVFSLENIFGLDHLHLRVTSIEKSDKSQMSSYKWNPSSSLQRGSTKFSAKDIHLVWKSSLKYEKCEEYEVLNTEMRSQLFAHAYGYRLISEDFGQLKALSDFKLKVPLEKTVLKELTLVYRNFGIIRMKTERILVESQIREEGDEDEEDLIQIENHYSLISFFSDFSCLKHCEIFIHVKIFELNQELNQKMNVAEMFNQQQMLAIAENSEEICSAIIQKLVLQKNGAHQFEIFIDKDIQPMKKVLDALKSERLFKQLNQDDQIQNELDIKQYQFPISQLVDCPKLTTISIINRKIFKITAYFATNLKNVKLSPNQTPKVFDWQLIYIDCFSRKSQRSFYIIVTEKDLVEICNKIKEQQIELYKDLNIVNSKIKKENLIEFVMDCLIFDKKLNQLKLSTSHLRIRLFDRTLAKQVFSQQGGRFINKIDVEDDPDMNRFQSSIPQIEMTRKLLLNLEKEFADKTYDVKIYELTLKSMTGVLKYQFEIFYRENPSVVYRVDFTCDATSHGKKILFERFNIIEQLEGEGEEGKVVRDAMVLAIIEQSFPHEVTFVLLEPSSHILWSYKVENQKLNFIESHSDKEYFARNLKKTLEVGLMRDASTENVKMITPGYQKNPGQVQEKDESLELWSGYLNELTQANPTLLYGKNIKVQNQEIEFIMFFDPITTSIGFQIARQDASNIAQVAFQYNLFKESGRVLSGFIGSTESSLLFIYTLEACQGSQEKEKGIRATLFDVKSKRFVINVALTSKELIDEKTHSVYEDLKYSFTSSNKDSFTLFQKLNEIYFDFGFPFNDSNQSKASISENQLYKNSESNLIENQKVAPSQQRLLYRKVIKFNKKQFQLSILYEKEEKCETSWKVILNEIGGSLFQEEFMFELSDILTPEELNQVNAKNERVLKLMTTSVVERRLKLKEVSIDQEGEDKKGKRRPQAQFLVYFTDPKILLNPKNGVNKARPFDIKQSYIYSFIEPGCKLSPQDALLDKIQSVQVRLITQLLKDDLTYDISEVLNPYELILRIKVYDQKSLKMVSLSEVREVELKKELIKDSKSFLVEPQRREELARYLIQNSFYDEEKKKVHFLISHNQ